MICAATCFDCVRELHEYGESTVISGARSIAADLGDDRPVADATV